MNEEYKLIPLRNTQSISVDWKLSQDEYDRLVKGHSSNWSVFLYDEVVHFCRIGGEEFYRFAVNRVGDGAYTVNGLESYTASNFYKSAKMHDWDEEKIQQHQNEFKDFVLEEVAGLLKEFFGIYVND